MVNEKRALWSNYENKNRSEVACTVPAQFREVSGYVHGVGGSPVHTADASGHKNLETNE
jgi:hypothetical protein